MLWRITSEAVDAAEPGEEAGRFVLHRHEDASGPHQDLRLEHGGFLVGWRVAGDTLDGGPCLATEKMPHPLRWLEEDGGAERADAGSYAWVERGPQRRVLLLKGERGTRRITAEPVGGFEPGAAAALVETMEKAGVPLERLPLLAEDGLTARRRAVTRLLGLGRELDGDAFDADLMKRMLEGLTLDEVHAHLRSYEARFDARYPPRPVSRPESIENEADGREGDALAILRA